MHRLCRLSATEARAAYQALVFAERNGCMTETSWRENRQAQHAIQRELTSVRVARLPLRARLKRALRELLIGLLLFTLLLAASLLG